MELAPIVLFVYNRSEHTRKTIEALKKNRLANESELFIFSDAPKDKSSENSVKEVREYIKTITGLKKIVIKEAKQNKGLANSVIDGVTEIIKKYEKVIVLEDDLVTSINFLEYMNEALEFYKDDKRIWSISGYNPPIKIPKDYEKDIYLGLRASSWGWGTWKGRWDKNDWKVEDYRFFIKNKKLQKLFNRGGNDMTDMLTIQMEGKIDSWAIRWCYSQFKNKSYTIFPKKSKVQNIGMDGSGIHCGISNHNNTKLDSELENLKFIENIEENKKLIKEFKNHFKPKTLKGKLAKFFKKMGVYSQVYIVFRNVKNYINYVKGKELFISDYKSLKVKWLGNSYGGFYLIPDLNKNSIVYSFGIGEDISFDKSVIEMFNCQVFAFDPTPKSVAFVKNNIFEIKNNFNFHAYGIDKENGIKSMYLPKSKNHVSGSLKKHDVLADNFVDVEMKNLSSIFDELKHKKVDVLKMDIEGSELDIIDDIINSKLEINQLLVEFHHRFSKEHLKKSKIALKKLKRNGYKITGISKSLQEVSFIREGIKK